jgi:hypothetical protein
LRRQLAAQPILAYPDDEEALKDESQQTMFLMQLPSDLAFDKISEQVWGNYSAFIPRVNIPDPRLSPDISQQRLETDFSLRNRFSIVLQPLCDRFAIALKSPCNRLVIALQSLCNRFTIALQSLCNRFAIAL